jgi:hypothetical protein
MKQDEDVLIVLAMMMMKTRNIHAVVWIVHHLMDVLG